MNADRLLEVLAHGHDGSGADCPDGARLAAYVDKTLDRGARESITAHLADCRDCRGAVAAALAIETTATADAQVPALLLARAFRLVGRRPLVTPVWAAAATVLLAVGLAFLLRPSMQSESFDESFEPTRQSRFVPHQKLVPHISLPADSATVTAKALAVRWTAVPGARYYAVRIVDDDGDVVLEERVAGTEWKPENASLLVGGADYFVRVDAYIDDAKPRSSAHVLFTFVP